MKIEVHILTHDAEPMLEWSLRHYSTFASKIVVHDGGPEFLSSVVCARHKAHWSAWETHGKLNDELAMRLKNECWHGTDADWVICADCDELIYFPDGWQETLERYTKLGAAMIRPYGWELFSETVPEGEGQIYDYVKQGARDDKWYGKPILFSPKMILESGFGIGAHEANPLLKSGRRLYVGQFWPHAQPPTYLLHCRHIGPAQLIADRYDAQRQRLSELNERNGWGNFKPGMEHVEEKRAHIVPNLTNVIEGTR